MSWKLAELRWRHDIGLYESRWEKEGGTLPVERKKAAEAFERHGREPSSRSASRRFRNSIAADDLDAGLGEPFQQQSPAFRSSVEHTTHNSIPPPTSRHRVRSCSSLVSLLQTSAGPSKPAATLQEADQDEAAESNQAVRLCRSCSALFRPSSQPSSSISYPVQSLEIEPSRHVFFDHSRGHNTAQDAAELEHLLSQRESVLSSSDLTDRLLWQTPSEVSQVIQIPDVDEPLQFRREILDPSAVEAFDNLLEFEGTVFELLNTCDTDRLWDVGSPQDFSETHWPSTVSQHQSTSFLIPLVAMADKSHRKAELPEANIDEKALCEEDPAKPRTPKRRMTLIYDDYPTAVSMIRSGTPRAQTPTSPSGFDNSSNKFADIPDIPKTQDRKFSHSMMNVRQKLGENDNDLQITLPNKVQALKRSATTPIPSATERRVSVPVFPLPSRDSDEENEKIVARGERPSAKAADNLAGIQVDHDDIPLREIGLAEVRSRPRGDAVSSQEIRASSAEFDHIDNSVLEPPKQEAPDPSRASNSGVTDTSTIGKIVSQYVSASGEEVDNTEPISSPAPLSTSPEGHCKRGDQAQYVEWPQFRYQLAANVGPAGPAPSWPLPNPPPVPPRSSKRRDSSGILSSPGAYGNTGRLLDLSSPVHGMSNASSSAEISDGLCSVGAAQLKPFKSSDDLVSGSDLRSSSHFVNDGIKINRTRLSHVSEMSSGQDSSELGWTAAVGYSGKLPRATDRSEHVGDLEGSGKAAISEVLSDVELCPTHRLADNAQAQPYVASSTSRRRLRGADGGAGLRFGSVDQVLAGEVDTDADSLASADDADWETIHTRSQRNLPTEDVQRVDLVKTPSIEVPSISSLSLGKAPVSAWDPLSNNRAGFGQSEKKLKEMLSSTKKSTQNNQVDEVEAAGTNDSNMPTLTGPAKASFPLLSVGKAAGRNDSHIAAGHQAEPFVQSSHAVRSQPHAHHHYRHPTPLQPQHKHPFIAHRPVLHPLTKTHSTSSTYTMADQTSNGNNRNDRNNEPTSSGATGSPSVGSFSSRQELEAEIARYDPDRPRVRRQFPNARLTVDRRVREARLDPEVVRVQRQLAWYFRLFSVLFYLCGGFMVMNSMASCGVFANDLMLQVSRALGLPVVGTLHEEDVQLAEKWEAWCLVFWFLVLCACVGVVAWAVKASMQA